MFGRPELYFDLLSRRCGIACVGCPSWLNQQNMGLFLREWPVLDAFRDNVQLSGPKDDVSLFCLDRHDATQNEEKVIRVVMRVPYKFPLDRHYHHVVAVER